MTVVGIADLGRIANPAPGRRLIAVLSAYFDASSGGGPPGVSSVAGYVAPLEEWERVEKEWRRGLADWRISRFRMSDLNKELGIDRAELCQRFFERIIRESGLTAVGAALLNQDWHRPDWGLDSTPRLSNPYEQCLDLAFKVLGRWAERRFPSEPVAVISCSDASRNKIEAVFERRRLEFPNLKSVMLGIPKDVLPLQCADLGAGRLRQSWTAIAADKACELPWGEMPAGKGTAGEDSFWSLRGGAVVLRSLRLAPSRRSA